MVERKGMMPDALQKDDFAYRMLFENAGDPIFVHGEDKIFDVNTKACELLGYTKDELLSMEPSSVDAYEERVNMPGRMARLRARGAMSFETIHRRKDGTPVSVEVTASIISWNGKAAVMSICRDLTRRKRAENILLTAALEWQTTFDSVRDVIFLLDSEFKILRCNKAASDMFGSSGKDILGRRSWEVVHGATEPIPECPIVRMKNTKRREMSVIKSGDLWLEVTADPILDEEGEVSGAIHVISDITELKEKEKELASSYERFKLILEGAPEGILIADIKTKMIKYSNPAVCSMLGYGAEEFCNMSIQEIHPAADWTHVLSEFESQSQGEKILAPDIPCLCKDGRVIYADINTTKLVLEGSECNVGFFRNITERKRAEEELKQLLSLLNATLESTADGILVVDSAGKIIYFNSRFVKMWGIPEDIMDRGDDNQTLNHVLQQLRNPELFLNKVKYLYAHPEEESFDVIEFKDGKIFERYSQPQRIGDSPVGRVWSFRDVTTSRKAAESLNSRERQYRSLVETTNTGYVVIDLEGRVLDANQEYLRLAGKNELKEIIGRKVTEWTAENEKGKNAQAVKKCGMDGHIRNLDIDYVDSSGKITPVEINATAVNSEEGPRILTLCRDITERRQFEERLCHSERMEAVGHLAGGIAHDFNNQLMGIMGYAEMLYNKLDDPGLKSDAENILCASRKASDLTRDLLAFSRRGKFLSEPVNVHKIIEEVFSILEHGIDKKIEIKRMLKADSAIVTGDPTQLKNALLNLSFNARDALPSGGEIVISTENVNMEDIFGREKWSNAVKGRYLKVCVIDDGIGIDDDTSKHIFEPFYTTKQLGRGTGMGLASVYGTVKNHNGVINVSSVLGEGSVFSLYFPVLESRTESEEIKTNPVLMTRKKTNILLVDDEEIVRDMMTKALRSFGYKIVTCMDGMEAVDLYRQSWKDFDLVILDMMMPRMNGRDAFFEMRSINGDIKALLISGFSIDGEAQSLLDAGMKGFIQKPFNFNELSKIIGNILNET